MRALFSVLVVILVAAYCASAQKSNDAISKQIKSLKAEKAITLNFDAGSDTSKIMVVSENFDGKEASKAGLQAMNFGMAVFYQGKSLTERPERFDLSFWVMTKKPKFAAAHKWIVALTDETLDLGEARYTSKPRDNMEYLNFKISRTDLAKIAAQNNVRFKLGNADFAFTSAQMTLFKNLLALADNK